MRAARAVRCHRQPPGSNSGDRAGRGAHATLRDRGCGRGRHRSVSSAILPPICSPGPIDQELLLARPEGHLERGDFTEALALFWRPGRAKLPRPRRSRGRMSGNHWIAGNGDPLRPVPSFLVRRDLRPAPDGAGTIPWHHPPTSGAARNAGNRRRSYRDKPPSLRALRSQAAHGLEVARSELASDGIPASRPCARPRHDAANSLYMHDRSTF